MWSSKQWDIMRVWHGSLSVGVLNVVCGCAFLVDAAKMVRSSISGAHLNFVRMLTVCDIGGGRNERSCNPILLHRQSNLFYSQGFGSAYAQGAMHNKSLCIQTPVSLSQVWGTQFAILPEVGGLPYRVHVARKTLSIFRKYNIDFSSIRLANIFARRMFLLGGYSHIRITRVVVVNGSERERVVRIMTDENSGGVPVSKSLRKEK